jgi:hypothetical protein
MVQLPRWRGASLRDGWNGAVRGPQTPSALNHRVIDGRSRRHQGGGGFAGNEGRNPIPLDPRPEIH